MKAKVIFEIEAPVDCSEKQFEEWLKMELGAIPTDTKHPLFIHDLRCRTEKLKIEIKR